jgi:hypothetical protein
MLQAIDRVMQAYSLMATLTPEDQADARERLKRYLHGMSGDDHALAVEGLRFLRGVRPLRGRRGRPSQRES